MYISEWLGGGGRPQVMQKSDMHVGIPLYGPKQCVPGELG